MVAAVISMVRKKRTEQPGGGEGSESEEVSGGHGGGAPLQQPQQQQQGGRYQGSGRGYAPQHQAGGNQGRGSYGGGRSSQRGGMASQQYYGGIPQYIQQQGRGTPQQQHYGGPSEYSQLQGRETQQHQYSQQQQRGGGGRGGFVPSTSVPPRPSNPELHQATQALHQAGIMTQPLPYVKSAGVVEPEAHSLSFVPEPTSQVTQQFQQLSVQQEGSSSEIVRPIPATSKSLRFPLRPGRGSTGSRCIVKANHFFAELPDKDLHQYDVSLSCNLCLYISLRI